MRQRRKKVFFSVSSIHERLNRKMGVARAQRSYAQVTFFSQMLGSWIFDFWSRGTGKMGLLRPASETSSLVWPEEEARTCQKLDLSSVHIQPTST